MKQRSRSRKRALSIIIHSSPYEHGYEYGIGYMNIAT